MTATRHKPETAVENVLSKTFRRRSACATGLAVLMMVMLLLLGIALFEMVRQTPPLRMVTTPPPSQPERDTIEIDRDLSDLEVVDLWEEHVVIDDLDHSLSGVDIPDDPVHNLKRVAEAIRDHRGARSPKVAGMTESQQAVALGLKWLAAHQLNDGGWDFDHGQAPLHRGPVDQAGPGTSRTGATAVALLPFLGAGQTHLAGEYQESVRWGLHFLGTQIQLGQNGGDLRDGSSLENHALAAIALCEAYALTQDRTIMPHAQASLDYITHVQDKVSGGWRSSPGQPSDINTFGWTLMALKSGHLAYLQVDKPTIARATQFLDSVQQDGGAFYGDTAPGMHPTPTAVGLLCRIYLGWKKDQPALQRGVTWLSQQGPRETDMLFNVFATEVLSRSGGEEWRQWKHAIRGRLVSTQVRWGTPLHEQGSWTPADCGHVHEQGGRLLETALSIMALEATHRRGHYPLNGRDEDEADF